MKERKEHIKRKRREEGQSEERQEIKQTFIIKQPEAKSASATHSRRGEY